MPHDQCPGGNIADVTKGFTFGTALVWHPTDITYKVEFSPTEPTDASHWQDAVDGQHASTTLKANKVYSDALHTFFVFPKEQGNFWLRMYPLPAGE